MSATPEKPTPVKKIPIHLQVRNRKISILLFDIDIKYKCQVSN